MKPSVQRIADAENHQGRDFLPRHRDTEGKGIGKPWIGVSDQVRWPFVRLGFSTYGWCLALILSVLPMRAATENETARRTALLRALEEIMGPFPGPEKRCPLDVRIEEERETNGVIRRQLTYQSEPGSRVPAYLLLPRDAVSDGATRRFPAVLALHQTHAAGRKVVVGLGNSPDDEYGIELARRGYVVLAPPYPHLADYAPDLKGLGYASGTMKAIWDNVRGLDLLASLPFVRTNGLGSIGHSLGGHNGVFTAAFDPRIQIVISSCGLDSFRDYAGGNPAVWQPGKGWCQERYMPRLAGYQGRLSEIPFDFPQVLAAIAPRRVLLFAPEGDDNFQWRSVDRVAAEAREWAAKGGVTADIRVVHPKSGHRFPPEFREEAYRQLDEILKSR